MMWVGGGGVVMSKWEGTPGKPGSWRVKVAGGEAKALNGKRVAGDQRLL